MVMLVMNGVIPCENSPSAAFRETSSYILCLKACSIREGGRTSTLCRPSSSSQLKCLSKDFLTLRVPPILPDTISGSVELQLPGYVFKRRYDLFGLVLNPLLLKRLLLEMLVLISHLYGPGTPPGVVA